MGFQADLRAACVEMLVAYGADAGIKLQVYPARPRSIAPPTAFVDVIRESIDYVGITLRQRRPTADVIVVHGIFDSKEAADQKDAFVDGFLDWVNSNYHQAGANTLVAVTGTEDVPDYVPSWLAPPAGTSVYYATRITVEGLAQS
jgi:hypothetical protein